MIVDAGERVLLEITGVFSGHATVLRDRVACVPNRSGKAPADAMGGLRDGGPIFLSDPREEKDGAGLWSWRWRLDR